MLFSFEIYVLNIVELDDFMVFSMTAFARYEKKYIWGCISWEIRSLNQRYLDIYIDVPKYLHGLSWEIRNRIKNCLVRGKIECYLRMELDNTVISEFHVNEQLVHHLISSAKRVQMYTKEGKINPLLILSWPGVITYKKNTVDNINLVLLKCFEKTLSLLIQDREREGVFLKEKIEEKLRCMYEEMDIIRQCIPNVLDLKRKTLLEQINEYCTSCVDDIRLEQELLIITQKIDISEEIDRLTSHIEAVYHVLLEPGSIGRRLDFISQELCREANTIASKSINFNITQSAISLKVFIEQIREQVQNIE